MSTLPIRVTALPQLSPLPAFSRIGAVISLLITAYSEALQEMRKAQKKYPYAGL